MSYNRAVTVPGRPRGLRREPMKLTHAAADSEAATAFPDCPFAMTACSLGGQGHPKEFLGPPDKMRRHVRFTAASIVSQEDGASAPGAGQVKAAIVG